MATFDIILDSQGELQESNNDFVTGFNDNNLIRYNVEAFKGEYKEFPLSGIGIAAYLNSNVNTQTLKRVIIEGLKSDVFANARVDVSNFPNVININGVEIAN